MVINKIDVRVIWRRVLNLGKLIEFLRGGLIDFVLFGIIIVIIVDGLGFFGIFLNVVFKLLGR